MTRLVAILILFVVGSLITAGDFVFAQDPQGQESGGVSFPVKNDSNVSQLLLDSIGELSGAATQSGDATKGSVTSDSGKGGRSVAKGVSASGGAPGTMGDLVRFDSSDNVQVYVHLASTDEASLQQVRNAVVEVEIEAPEHGLIQAWVDPDNLQAVASLEAVKRVTPPDYGYTEQGSKLTEGDAVHRANLVREFSGLTGEGVKVGVISDGARAWTTARATGDLPSTVEINLNQENLGHEGTAMMEIVHDLAPDAQLAFSGSYTSLGMAQAILWLANDAFGGEGADIIVDDISHLFQPYFEDGIVARAAADAVAGGTIYVAAAGNAAEEHYEGDFVNNGDGFHAFDGGSDITMRLLAPSGVLVVLQWNDEFGASGNDYDLYLCPAGLTPTAFNLFNGICGASTNTQNGDDDPLETAWFSGEGQVDVFIKRSSGQNRRLKMFFGASQALEYGVPEGSIVHQEAVPGVLTVGAVDAADPGNDDIEPSSSLGPSVIYFPTEETRKKPDVVAATGVSVTGSGGFPNPFFGTSAAAPHVAGIAALLVEAQRLADPTMTRKQVADAVIQKMKDTAVDLGPTGHDNQTGYGRADALAAVESLDQLGATTFTVNSTGDEADSSSSDGDCDDGNGNCTLRAAIQEANRLNGSIVRFNISGGGTRTIQPASSLPTITRTVFIDGFSQPGASASNYLIELDGTNAGADVNGLTISGKGSWIRGLVINRFNGNGIVLQGSGGEQVIDENRIGTDASGTTDMGNGKAGVLVSGADRVVLKDNLISGNDGHGVELSGGADDVEIASNTIGANAIGSSDLGNTGSGIRISDGDRALVFGNVIVGNDSHGVSLTGGSTESNAVDENFIGVNESGASIANGGSGVHIGGRASFNVVVFNIIAHNTGDGVTVVSLSSLGNTVRNNSIHSNGGLGIDLNDDGVTANDGTDSDHGPNSLQNYPVLTHAGLSSGSASIGFNMHVTRNFRFVSVDFYASGSCDASGNGEGKEWLGHALVMHETSGNQNFVVNTADGTLEDYDYPSGAYITAAASRFGDTSEFSPCIQSTSPPGLTLSEDSIEVEEGNSTNATYTVRMASEPSDDATVDISIEGDDVVTLSTDSLTFTAGATGDWATAQTVTVTAVSDSDPKDAATILLHTTTIDGKKYVSEWLPVEVKDDDVPPISLTADGSTGVTVDLSMDAGATATYTVALTEQPAGDVVVDIGNNQNLRASPPSLTFTRDDYNTAQDVTLTALPASRNNLIQVHHSVRMDGIDYYVARVVVAIKNQVVPEVILTEEAINVNEGETATYTIVPASEPYGNFTIRPQSTDTNAVTVSPESLTFTPGENGNWQTAQTVTVTAVSDDDEFDNVVPIRHQLRAIVPTGSIFRFLEEVEVTVIDGNRAPYFEEGLNTVRSINEGSPEGTAVGDPVIATDLNQGSLTYAIDSQKGGPYTVDSATGQIRVGDGANLDYERRTTQQVKLTATDSGGLSDTIVVSIEIAEVNEPPVVTGVSGSENTTFPENGRSTVGRFRATDPEGDSFEWSVDPTGDGSFFSIDDGGYLDFNDPPDFEDRADANGDGVYEPIIVAMDGEGNAGELAVKVTVTDVNEPPTVEGRTELALSENDEAFDETYSASDPEGSSTTFTWSVSGTDGGDFTINRDTGVLTFRNLPDFERPADSNRDNEYLVQVRASDGQYTGRLDVKVTVTDVNEPPEFNSSSLSKTSFSYAENRTSALYTYRADDPEQGAITWSLSGDDSGDFAISESGVLTFAEIPDFEMPDDANQDNEYLVTVEARDDGFNRATLDVTVTVTNSTGAEEPTITTTSDPSAYREHGTGTVYTFRARDPQGRPVSWSVTGTDSHAFQISSSGVLTFGSPPDFESPSDADRDNRYEITVVVTDDQGLTDSVEVTVTVTNHNEGVEPTISTRRPPSTYRENGASAVYTFRASDPQRQTMTWTLEGTDRGDFTLTRDSSGRGVLAFNTPPDFENPSDSDRQNDYELTVIATDEDGHADRLAFTVTVTDVNEGPEITRVGSIPGSVPETYDPTQVLARYMATDPEDTSAVITQWSTSGTDGGDFVMNERGELRFRNQPDHERPADSNRDNVYVFTVRASDGRYYGEFSETVTVENVNEPPTITTTGSSATALRQNENRTTRLYSYRATDPEGETITWSVGGVDGRFFAISERGEFSFRETSPPDYERPGDSGGDNVYSATVRAQDSGGITAELEIAVTVTPVNEGPEVTGGQSAFTISENQDLPGAAYTAFDPEGGTVTRWSLGGRDGGDFTISSGGLLTFRNLPDYERPADSNRDNLYELQVKPYDGRYYGAFAVTVTVNDINEPPEIRSGSQTSFTQNENQTSRLYTYSATDPERATITWSVGGVDGRFFAIDERGQFSFSESSPPDFEQPGDSGSDNVYEATIQVRDDGGNTASLPVTVTVREVNEGPEVSGPSTFTIAENRGLPGAVYTATDPEGAYVTRWRLGGRDGGDFFITQGGTLYFRSPPDFERPADSNRDNVYEVSIQPADGRNTGSYPVTVTVTDVNEPPEIRRGSTTFFTQPENRTSRLYTYSATDPERGMVAWSVGGTDGNLFIIDERGQFSFREDNPPDFDAPGDVGRDNLYYVTVQATDPEFNTARLPVIVRVTEVNEGPVITRQGSAPGSVSENHAVTQALAGYTASDPERPSVRITRWSTSGRDGGDFVMNALGELRFRNSPDFERPADANRDNVYEVTIRASDGRNTGTLEEVQVVTVADVNEPPTITTTSRTAFSQPENRTSTLYTFRATDPEGNTVTWTPAGTDGSSFTIDERGGFSFSDPPDFDNPRDAGRNNVYDVTVQARDEAFNTASLQVTVTVTDHNENVEPTITTRRPPSTYRENGTGAVYTFRASDPQRGTTITWLLTGTDAGAFTITRDSSGRGVLAFASSPDFESPADANRDNEYELAVVATDEEGYADRVDFTITVTNDNEGVEPTISTRRPSSTYRENGTSAVYTFRASDPQRDPITWSLQGTDVGDFSITRDSSGRGVLAFARPPDFESPADINRDNRYELAVVATDDGGNADRLDFTITVTDINEGPEIMLEGTAVTSVPENYADTQVLARYTARDPENPGARIYQWSTTGRDGGDFVISALGELRFRSSPDHERPADADRDNVYEVTVRAYDGRVYGMLEEPLMITVTEVNEAPVITTRSRTEFTVRENSTSVLYTYRATDQDQNNRIRWSVEGTDGRAFAIYNGMLTFRRLPDLELPVDSNQDNTYEITVVAADSGGLRDTVNAAITVTDQSEGPVIAGTTSFTVAENYDITQVLGSYTATDARDMRTVHPQWSLSGRDGGDFVIDRYSGALTFRNTPDYDRPADSDRDNVYEVTVRAHDSVAYGYLNATVTVNNINEGAPVVTGRTSQTVRENTTSAIYTYRATDPDLADPIAWSTGGTDGHLFRMSDRGELSFRQAPDYDIPRDSGGINEYSIEVVATDSGGLQGILAVTITVTNLNEGPTVSGPANFTIDENQVLPSSARYTATDPDTLTPATITWRVSGRDGGDFTIDRETGVLAFRITPNYERPADSNRDNVYEVTVRAYDGRNYGDFDVTVMVLAVNEGPEITGRDAFTYRENGTAALYTYRATDPEGNDFTWHLGGLDASDFGISDQGVLTFALPPNFDSPTGSGTDRNQYLVTVQAGDDQGNTGELPVTVTVTDQNEGPTVSGRTEISVQENLDTTSILATYSAADPEGQTITRWSLSGRDGGDFRISENGELAFRNIPDYDRPADSNRDNVYLVTVRAYDGRVYGSLDVTVTVRDENEAAPVVTGRDAITVRENTTSTLYTYRASDADRNTVFTWSVQGADGSAFMIDERGALTFSSPPNYEIPGDAGGNNVYAITIVATDDGGSQGTLDVTVTVTEVNEGPEITGATTYSVVEGQDLIGAFFTARDPEDPSIEVVNWRTSGTDGGDFTISQDGVLTFPNTPDYERPADSNRDNVYLVTVQVSDGRYYGSLEATVTVTDLNEAAPTVTGRETLSIRENTANTLYTYRASDMDRGATIIWSVGGTDGDDFEISEQGALTFASPPDYERPADSDGDNVYEITIRASDGSSAGELGVTITVTAVNEGPEITGRASITVSENHEAVLASYTGRDPEDTTADITRWSVSGRDGGDFTINSDGELTFRYPPNYERPADANRDNVYEVTVRASEGRVYGNYDVRVTVEELDEAPEFRRGSRTEFSFRENGTSSLYTYRATDPEGAVVAWSVSGTDGEDFEISTGGVLEFRDPPDYDDPADDGGDNEYEVTVVATDQTGHASNLPVMVTVTDVNEGPTISGASEFTVRENHDAALGTYTARDPEIPDLEITRWSVTGRDGGDFTINEAGELTFRHPPDSERPADANRDSIYEVTVRASDGRYYGTFDVTVTVEAVDEDPEFHGNSQDSFSYQENQTAAIYTYRATDPEGEDVTWDLSGTDSNAFVISEEGELTFLNAPDYEDPVDSDDDNVYEVTVEASDENGNTAQLEVTVTVVNLTD